MDYITKTLGIPVVRSAWTQQGSLPYFLTEKYGFEQANIGSVPCLIIHPTGELDTINAIKKHVVRIHEASKLQIVFELAAISRQRRSSFIEAKLPFVVPDKQLYLPFLGAQLTERCDTESVLMMTEKLQPSAQMLLFAFILNGNNPMQMAPLAERFGFSAMTITRAAKQLVEMGFVSKTNSGGAQKVIRSEFDPKTLYQKTKPYLINPVRKTVFINKDEVGTDMFCAGVSALSQMSMLNPPTIETWGTVGSKVEGQMPKLMDSEKQCGLQLWRYDPRRISQTEASDPLSMAASFMGDTDERIEQCIEEILKKVW